MLKIGLIDIDTSHPIAFATELENKNIPMRYAYLYNGGFRDHEQEQCFARRFGAEIVANPDDMIGKIDIAFIQSCNWSKHLKYALPFIEKGVPVFLDKPMAGSVSDIKKLRRLDEKGALILGSSAIRYSPSIIELQEKIKENAEKLLNIFCTVGVDEFNYGIHAVEAIQQIAKSDAISCTFVGSSKNDYDIYCETYFIRFENGVTAVYNIVMNQWQPFNVTAMTTKNTYSFVIDANEAYDFLLKNISDELLGKAHNMASVHDITESCLIMIAGKKSRACDGAEIRIDSLSKENFDGFEFEKKYIAESDRMYTNI